MQNKKIDQLPEGIKAALDLIEKLNEFAPTVIDQAMDAYYDEYGMSPDNLIDGVEEYNKRWI